MAKNGNGAVLNVPITFNGVSVGREKVSVGIGIDHSRVTREQMGDLFVNRSLDVELCTGEPDDQPLPGMEDDDVRIVGTVTAASYSEKKASFGTRLAMPKGDAQPADFWDLAGRSGWLKVNSSREADEPNGKPLAGQQELPHPDVEVGKDRPRTGETLAAVAELRKQPLPTGKDGLTKPQRQLVEAAGITTLGALLDLAVKGPTAVDAVLNCGLPTADEICRRVKSHGAAATPAKEPPKAVVIAVPDLDAAEDENVPGIEETKHDAWVSVAPVKSGSWWRAGWGWSGDGGAGEMSLEDESAPLRKDRKDAIAAAAGQLVDSIWSAPTPKSKAAQDRRRKAIDACKTFYGECERGGKTIFDAAKKAR